MITIAIPTAAGQLHGYSGGCREFTLVQADPDQRRILSIRPVAAPPRAPGLREPEEFGVADLDGLDGTPVFDIKPHVPDFDVFAVERVGWFPGARGRRIADGRFVIGAGNQST